VAAAVVMMVMMVVMVTMLHVGNMLLPNLAIAQHIL
jgi:hypothetical protein